MTRQTRLRTYAAALAIVGLSMTAPAFAADQTILNVSYDPTRELYSAYQRGLRRASGRQTTGDTRHDPAVAWRLGARRPAR